MKLIGFTVVIIKLAIKDRQYHKPTGEVHKRSKVLLNRENN